MRIERRDVSTRAGDHRNDYAKAELPAATNQKELNMSCTVTKIPCDMSYWTTEDTVQRIYLLIQHPGESTQPFGFRVLIDFQGGEHSSRHIEMLKMENKM
ncbi:hypothetical protein AVEN_25468-1 [Araneus ventricosus]|uniref:Uncharacterized protein n=1 Tax=Araneus ventricosus TaxID=182803 RepID=A0A4Y2P2J4_ARAVE|nr:hypothetical protein AVEN_25468-1 [Araneus ventricosus]